MLVARNTKQSNLFPERKNKNAVFIGAGLAGAAVCERLCARGWEVELVERHDGPAQEASGNPAGAFHPVVTPDDSVFARLTRAGFLHSLSRWKRLENLRWDRCGLLQLARDEREAASQLKAVSGLPPDYAQAANREEASAHAGVALAAGGLWFPEAGWIDPRSLVTAQLDACGSRLHRRFQTELKELPRDRIVILANSFDAPEPHPVPHLRLRRVRGPGYLRAGGRIQATAPSSSCAAGWCCRRSSGTCVAGASFDIDDADPAPRADSDAGNLERLERMILLNSKPKAIGGRVGFRSVTPDRLPVVGALGKRLWRVRLWLARAGLGGARRRADRLGIGRRAAAAGGQAGGRAASRALYAARRIERLTSFTSRIPHSAIETSSSAWMISSARVTPASPIAPRP